MISMPYYIHINEIPGELSRENVISLRVKRIFHKNFSHVNRSPLPRQHNKLHLSQQKN